MNATIPPQRAQEIARAALNRARHLCPPSKIDPEAWLAEVYRHRRSLSEIGRVAALLAVMRPVRRDVYLREIAEPLHLSRRNVRDALAALQKGGFIDMHATLRPEAAELTLRLPANRPEDSRAGR